MRGSGGQAAGLFSYIRLEDRIAADHPLRAIRCWWTRSWSGILGGWLGFIRIAPFDPARTYAQGDACAGVFLGSPRAPVDGADRLQDIPKTTLTGRPGQKAASGSASGA